MFPLVSMSASWFLVSMYLIWIFGSKWIRSNNQSSATLWVLKTCFIVGLLSLIIILITVSLSSNTNNKASWRENWTSEGTRSILFKTLIIPWDRTWFLSRQSTDCPVLLWVWIVFPRSKKIRSHKSRPGIPSNLKQIIVSYTSNLLDHKYDFQKRTMFLQKWILNQDLRKIGVLKQSQSALLDTTPHMTILFIFTRMMNIWNQSIQTFVTGHGPFWSIVQVCSLTIEHQVSQSVPSDSISEPFESILVTILLQISFLPL